MVKFLHHLFYLIELYELSRSKTTLVTNIDAASEIVEQNFGTGDPIIHAGKM